MQNPKKRLATVVKAFEQWRQTRHNSTQITPTELRQQAVSLLEYFSSSHIMAALHISGSNLKRWSQQQQQSTEQVAEFVPLPLVEQPVPAQLNLELLNLELTLGQGCHIRLSGDISPAHLSAITQHITANMGNVV